MQGRAECVGLWGGGEQGRAEYVCVCGGGVRQGRAEYVCVCGGDGGAGQGRSRLGRVCYGESHYHTVLW